MVHIKITKGLDIPIKGHPTGSPQPIIPAGHAFPLGSPPQISLNLKEFDNIKFRLLTKIGDVVKIGQPLAEDKANPGRMFVSPAAGIVKEIRRGPKRVLHDIIIDVAKNEDHEELGSFNLENASIDDLTKRLLVGGCFAYIRSRPFNFLANPLKRPKSIFVKAIESAPFIPPSEMQVSEFGKEFQTGLDALSKLSQGPVHLIYSHKTTCSAFIEAKGVQKHTTEGPHPVANASLHIQRIDPIKTVEDIIWTVTALDVVAIGYLLMHGRCFNERILSIAGPGILPNRTGYFKARNGYPVAALIAGRIESGWQRFISGDPLMGEKVGIEDFLGFHHTAFCVIPENTEREFLHFLGLGIGKYSYSKAYISGHLDNSRREYDFTTSQHGEHRAFIDSAMYDKVMPLDVPTMLLVKAIMAEDLELAETLGLLEVDSEDFALPAFVCPSKMEMPDIVKRGLQRYANEVLA